MTGAAAAGGTSGSSTVGKTSGPGYGGTHAQSNPSTPGMMNASPDTFGAIGKGNLVGMVGTGMPGPGNYGGGHPSQRGVGGASSGTGGTAAGGTGAGGPAAGPGSQGGGSGGTGHGGSAGGSGPGGAPGSDGGTAGSGNGGAAGGAAGAGGGSGGVQWGVTGSPPGGTFSYKGLPAGMTVKEYLANLPGEGAAPAAPQSAAGLAAARQAVRASRMLAATRNRRRMPSRTPA